MGDFTAMIDGNSERATTWRRVLGTNRINIESPVPSRANLPGKPEALIYELDLELLAPDQRERLIDHIAKKFNLSAEQAAEYLDLFGCPVLADDVAVTIHNPQKWVT